VLFLLRAEFRRLTATTMSRLALVALMCVPIIYGGLYLWANQDPYANLDRVPAALVVADTGATVDGEEVTLGQDVADTLLEDHDFDWRVVSAGQARTGLRDGEFGFALTLPAGFSSALTSAASADPTRTRVVVSTSDTNGYLSGTIAEQAAARVRDAVAEQVGEKAANALLVGLSDVRDSLGTAVTGADQLATAATSAADGGADLADGTAQVASGAASLSAGLDTLRNSTATLPDSTARLADGAHQVADGNAQLAAQGDQAAATAQDAADQVPAIRAEVAERLAATDLPADQQEALLAQLDRIGTGVGEANTAAQDLRGRLDALASGSAQVASGADQLAAAAPALSGGIGTAADGAADLATGADQASAGADTLADGLGRLRDGTTTLRDGLASGLNQIPASDADSRSTEAAAIADPLGVSKDALTSAGTYGAGLAPFFLSLAAWIGMYALFLIVRPLSRRAMTAGARPWRTAAAGWLLPVLLGLLQMVALYTVVTALLGFPVANPLGMFAFLALVSATFAAILLALNAVLGNVGQFLGLVLMVVQLVSAGGTFPWQTLPGPLAALHQALPMSYAVDGLRQLMYGGREAAALADAGYLAFWLLGGLALTLAAAARQTHHRTLRDLQPSLIG
jgi:putative membrane protein